MLGPDRGREVGHNFFTAKLREQWWAVSSLDWLPNSRVGTLLNRRMPWTHPGVLVLGGGGDLGIDLLRSDWRVVRANVKKELSWGKFTCRSIMYLGREVGRHRHGDEDSNSLKASLHLCWKNLENSLKIVRKPFPKWGLYLKCWLTSKILLKFLP